MTMHVALRWVKWVLGAALVLALLATGTVYGYAEYQLRRTYDAPLRPLAVAPEAVMATEGERLARILGCMGGCHGEAMEGRQFFQQDWVGRAVAPDLGRLAQTHDDAELERVIRRGVRADGRSVWAMPSDMYQHLADDDLAAVIARMRAEGDRGGAETRLELGPLGRLAALLGEFTPMAMNIRITPPARRPAGDARALGRYLALIACSECHGQNLKGHPDDGVPDLAIVRAYPEESFVTLMREGSALGGRELGLMSQVARSRFAHFRDDELAALHAYLQAATED
jgi:cytochrome c553